jgi:hypothetical protein
MFFLPSVAKSDPVEMGVALAQFKPSFARTGACQHN